MDKKYYYNGKIQNIAKMLHEQQKDNVELPTDYVV